MLVNTSISLSLHCSLLRGDGGVVGFVFVPALCIGVIPGGCFAWSPKEFN